MGYGAQEALQYTLALVGGYLLGLFTLPVLSWLS